VCGTVLAPLALGACGGGGGYGGSAKAPATTAAAPAATSSHQVTAGESEYKIVLSTSTVKPGTYRINAVNKGTIDHQLEITGPGVAGKKTGTISPGASAALTVTLKAGSYDIFCPLPGHKALGMNTELTVS
jgi:uncharacterized cupredoxin-like copper-binding protein